MTETVNDIAYHLESLGEDGAGPTLLMLHGFMGSGACFDHLGSDLASFCRPVTLDLLGHGRTEGPAEPDRYRCGRQVADLREIVRRLDRKPLYLYGYSMGGRLALQYALEHPETLKGLVLESAHPGLEDENERERRRREDEERAAAIEEDFDAFLQRWEELELFEVPSPISPAGEGGEPGNSPRRPDPKRYQRYAAIQRSQRPACMAASLRGFGSGAMPPAWDRLEGFGLPVLALAGEHDPKYRGIAANLNRLLPYNRVDIVPQAAHRVHLDQPFYLLKLITAFLTNHEDHEHGLDHR
ncbi:MAG: alpha/beta fold hydrolase [Balneolaceae bacterium]|nr:alpha/beta fold hydrolase [Balneolaceae bacterium]